MLANKKGDDIIAKPMAALPNTGRVSRALFNDSLDIEYNFHHRTRDITVRFFLRVHKAPQVRQAVFQKLYPVTLELGSRSTEMRQGNRYRGSWLSSGVTEDGPRLLGQAIVLLTELYPSTIYKYDCNLLSELKYIIRYGV